MSFGHKFEAAKQRMEAAKAEQQVKLSAKKQGQLADKLMADIGKRGEKLLAQNLHDDEKILAKVRGDFGQAFVVTDKHVFIVKWGFQAGSTFGGKCISYAYSNITGIQIKQQTLKALVQVLTPATQDNRTLSFWGGRGKSDNAVESDNAVTFSRPDAPVFQTAVNLAKDQMENRHAPTAIADNGLSSLKELAELREQGIITEAEFAAKKKQILGL